MIEPGLSRISRLVNPSTVPWRSIHVAGTNGKGSVCAYLSAMFRAGGVRCGRFTSPHLIDRWDCITVGEQVVTPALFHAMEERIKTRDQQHRIGATEFELLTATAFEIFTHERVELGVVEVGMGGRLDATNILDNQLATVITKIGYDHEGFLGNTIRDIAFHKAGIMRSGIDCVVDGSNTREVVEVLMNHAQDIGARLTIVHPDSAISHVSESLPSHQTMNFACATKAFGVSMKHLRPLIDCSTLVKTGLATRWPGRLEEISLQSLIPRKEIVLLDGAHNPQSAEALGHYVNEKFRGRSGNSVTWVFAASKGKNLRELFGKLIEKGDQAVIVKFGPVDGMPWVQSAEVSEIEEALKAQSDNEVHDSSQELLDGLIKAARIARGSPLVIAGSLYLVSEVHRLLRDGKLDRSS